jgi:hypothetical protein
MRAARVAPLLIIAQMTWALCASGHTPPAASERPLTLIPTAFEELNELRVNTGTKAVLRDGTMGPVYVMKRPSQGSTYLNFHVDVATATGSIVLQAKDLRLEGAAVSPLEATKGKAAPETVSYTPMDWFIDTGLAEVRGESLTVDEKAILQFTIEAPRAGLDQLTLFVRSQRVGTIREIRDRIAKDRGDE